MSAVRTITRSFPSGPITLPTHDAATGKKYTKAQLRRLEEIELGRVRIKPSGRRTAKLVIIGEAGGIDEAREGRPFVGAAGKKLRELLANAGIDARGSSGDVYFDNVLPFHPLGNNISAVPKSEMKYFVGKLHERIAALDSPNLIVPVGNVALRALVSDQLYNKESKTRLTITRARGFPFRYRSPVNGRETKTIPILHPSFLFRDRTWEPATMRDWQKATREMRFPEVRTDCESLEHIVSPTIEDIEQFAAEVEALAARDPDAAMSVDIETRRKPKPAISCIGFSYDPRFSITIPLEDSRGWRTKRDKQRALELVRRICHSRIPKVLQNGTYDAFWLRLMYGIQLVNYKWDLKAIHHALYIAEKQHHSLLYMASCDLNVRFWKDDAKEAEESERYLSNFIAAQTYNGLDNTHQRKLLDVYRPRLEEAGKMKLYRDLYARMFEPLTDVSVAGIPVNSEKMRQRYAELSTNCEQIRAELEKRAGQPLHGKKDLTTQKVKWFLYEKLGLPKQFNGHHEDRKVTSDEAALKKLALRWDSDKRVNGAISLILKHRKQYKQKAYFDELKINPIDGRWHCQFNQTQDTLRLSSSKDPMGFGGNAQNIDRKIRNVFVPEYGRIFVRMDYSQIEDRIVKVLTGNERLIAQARSQPWEFDVHTNNAMLVFGLQEHEVTKDIRHTAKRIVHGSNYDMGPDTMAEVLLKDGRPKSPKECAGLKARYLRIYAAIPKWHRETRQDYFKHAKLTNSWGHSLEIVPGRMTSEDYRALYAFRPQSEAGILLNQYALYPLWREIQARGWKATINNQIHDELLISCAPEDAWELSKWLRASMERPRTYVFRGRTFDLAVPASLTLGWTWASDDGVEFKKFPTKREFDEALKLVWKNAKKAWVRGADGEPVSAAA